MQVHVLPIGATIQRLLVPNGQGVAEDVVLGFDDPTQYQVRIWHPALAGPAVLHITLSLNGGNCCEAPSILESSALKNGGCNADQ